jgi:paraquat-inducible protein B
MFGFFRSLQWRSLVGFSTTISVRKDRVAVGVVKDVTISPDNKEAFIKVTMQKDVASFAVQGTQFWVVLPKVGFQGVSGLETLFEGSYIAVQPGPADAASKTDFKGHMSMESESVENTRTYFLDAMSGESIVVGDSVSLFRYKSIFTTATKS